MTSGVALEAGIGLAFGRTSLSVCKCYSCHRFDGASECDTEGNKWGLVRNVGTEPPGHP